MPAGPYHGMDDSHHISFEHRSRAIQDLTDLSVGADESTSSILRSVKEQELQFEQLTRELEEERKSVANQLEKCKLGSETASMSSISSTDESFHWRPPAHDQRFDEESEADSKLSGTNLVDSCLRVLEDRGLMSSDYYRDPLPEELYNQSQSTTSVTKVVTNRDIQQANPSTPNTSQSYINYTFQDTDNRLPPESPRSPASSHRDDPTPTQPPRPEYYPDSFDQQQSYRDEYDSYQLNGQQRPQENGQSPQHPDTSFQSNHNNYGGYTTTTTTTVDDQLQQANQSYRSAGGDDRLSDYTPSDQGRRDGYDVTTTTTRYEQEQYVTAPPQTMSNFGKPPSDRPMDSPREPLHGSLRGVSPAGSLERVPYGSHSRLPPPDYEEGVNRLEPPNAYWVPGIDPDLSHRSPSVNSANQGMPPDVRWRNPELPEVIEFLSHHNDMVKANAAAYLQHLSYMDNDVKTKTRTLGGIPVLVELVNSDIPEVHRAACGALKNLSYSRANEENKKAIKNAGGIPALVRLLRKTPDNDVRELVTGILWNLSSSKDLKRPVIDDGLTVLVNSVIVPHSGWNPNMPTADRKPSRDIYWSTVFRNASGVLRNVSSDGPYARTKLRECDGLVDAIVFIVKAAIGKNDIDNKSVENCVCVLRNLSYACQEVQDRKYLEKRAMMKQDKNKGDTTSCFGGSKKKKDPKDPKNRQGMTNPNYTNPELPPAGMGLLWHPTIVPVYLPLLYDCTNPETLEAAAGAIQNLAACEWQPSDEIREAVRKQKGLPVLVELLNLEADKVVCAAATALRNLSLDPQSKDLIGKYAMRQLVQRLPDQGASQQAPNSDETICALEALIYEVIKTNQEFAGSLLSEGGVDRLMYIVSNDKFEYKVRKFASSILNKMWDFKELHAKYRDRGWRDVNFMVKIIDPRRGSPAKSQPASADNTLNRPRMDQSGPTVPGYNENTLPYVNRQPMNNISPRDHNHDNNYHADPESIQMTVMRGPSTQAPAGPHGPDSPFYASVDPSRQDNLQRPDELDRRSDQYQPNHAENGRHGYFDPRNQSYEQAPPHDYDRGDFQRGPAMDDLDRHSDYNRGPARPGEFPSNAELNLSRQQDFEPPGGSPRMYRPEGDYTPQGSEYSRRDELRQDSYRQNSYQEQYPSDPTRREDYRPPGGVPLFPNLPPAPERHTPQPHDNQKEPLYARVVKQGNRNDPSLVLDSGSPSAGPPGGADSWV